MPTDPIDVSIVLYATGDGRSIDASLAVAERAIEGRRGEIVVAGLTDAALADQLRCRLPGAVILVAEQPISAAAARKRGAAAARGKRLLVVDRDSVVPAAWIDRQEVQAAPSAVAGSLEGACRPAAAAGWRCLLAWLPSTRPARNPLRKPLALPAPPGLHLIQEGMDCLARGDDDDAILHFRQVMADMPQPPPRVFLALANILFRMERLDEADSLYRELAIRFPNMHQGHAGSARVLLAFQTWQAAFEAWSDVAERFPEVSEARLGMAESLVKLGRFDEAEALLEQAANRWPEEVSILIARARLAAETGQHRQACDLWQAVLTLAPGNLMARAGLVRGLIDVVDVEAARRVFDAAGDAPLTPWYQSLLADIHAAIFDWPGALDVFRDIAASAPDDLAVRLREALFLVRAAGYTCEPRHLDRAMALCESLVGRFPHSLRARAALAEGYVMASRDDDAIRVIDRLPQARITNSDVAKLKAWRLARAGDVAGAKEIWQTIERGHYLPAIHAPPGKLEPLGDRAIEPAPGEVLLFTVIRDEAWRLPWFLDAYRKLGVDRFFVVDNGSTDGGTDYLLAQPDVHLFPTSESYAAAMSGMRWINDLVDRFGAGHWCLYVDVDELLVVPGIEDHGLRVLLDSMDRRGQEALRAFMLDMHGPTADHRPECRPGEDPLPLFPLFDATHHPFGAVECPYRQMSGGIRRLAGSTCDLTKTPIIRGGRSIRFLSSSHRTTPCVLADVTGVLLHFKLAGAPEAWTMETIGNRRPGCVRRHLADLMPGRRGDEARAFIGSTTMRYVSSRQLLALGLIECPEDFPAGLSQTRHDHGA
jgi:tetratricopeptide (TPR) repeat protein